MNPTTYAIHIEICVMFVSQPRLNQPDQQPVQLATQRAKGPDARGGERDDEPGGSLDRQLDSAGKQGKFKHV